MPTHFCDYVLVGMNCVFALAPAVSSVLTVSCLFLIAVDKPPKAGAVTMVGVTIKLLAV